MNEISSETKSKADPRVDSTMSTIQQMNANTQIIMHHAANQLKVPSKMTTSSSSSA